MQRHAAGSKIEYYSQIPHNSHHMWMSSHPYLWSASYMCHSAKMLILLEFQSIESSQQYSVAHYLAAQT